MKAWDSSKYYNILPSLRGQVEGTSAPVVGNGTRRIQVGFIEEISTCIADTYPSSHLTL